MYIVKWFQVLRYNNHNLIDRTLSVATIPGQRGSGSNSNERIFHIAQISKAGTSPSSDLMSYPGHLGRKRGLTLLQRYSWCIFSLSWLGLPESTVNLSLSKLVPWPSGQSFCQWSGRSEFIPRSSHTKDLEKKKKKKVIDATLLSTWHYKLQIKGKVEQSRERSLTLPYSSLW